MLYGGIEYIRLCGDDRSIESSGPGWLRSSWAWVQLVSFTSLYDLKTAMQESKRCIYDYTSMAIFSLCFDSNPFVGCFPGSFQSMLEGKESRPNPDLNRLSSPQPNQDKPTSVDQFIARGDSRVDIQGKRRSSARRGIALELESDRDRRQRSFSTPSSRTTQPTEICYGPADRSHAHTHVDSLFCLRSRPSRL